VSVKRFMSNYTGTSTVKNDRKYWRGCVVQSLIINDLSNRIDIFPQIGILPVLI
jgi:hypothetical protein